NPRSREGSDFGGNLSQANLEVISIHAPVKGATLDALLDALNQYISIHAPVKGATFSPWKIW
ncbi:hypothetical protein HMPREF3108_05690, partial [Streptococcus sp. HMSC10A01]